MKKVIRNILDVFRANLTIIMIFSVFIALEVYQLDYSVYSPGGLINVDNRIENKLYESNGSFNMTYISFRNGSLLNLAIAKIIPSYDIVKDEDIALSNEELNDVFNRDRILINSAVSNATYIAFTYANKPLEIIDQSLFIYYVDDEAITELKVGDKILEFDGKEVTSFEDLNNYIKSLNKGDKITIKVLRNNKEVLTTSTIRKDNIIGILISRINTYKKDPDLKYSYDTKESGSSGGLMLALAMYNSLVEEDITHGMKIAGTGTIEIDGKVGEIAGVKYKIKGAVKNKIDLFIVPTDNYEEALEVVNENKYDIKLLKADTFEQVLNELKNYK